MQVLPLNQVPGQGRGDEKIVSEMDMGHTTGESREGKPVKSCPSKVCQVNSAKASERQEGSGLKGEAWRSREAQPGKVREVLEGERWVKYILTENVR